MPWWTLLRLVEGGHWTLKTRALLQVGFLEILSPGTQKKLFSLADSFRYERGEIIFRQDDPSLYLYIIQTDGVAIKIHVPPSGPRRILARGPGGPFSWSALREAATRNRNHQSH